MLTSVGVILISSCFKASKPTLQIDYPADGVAATIDSFTALVVKWSSEAGLALPLA